MSVFRYESFSTDASQGILTCRYSVGGHDFTETVTLPPGDRWDTPAAQAAARWVFLLAGVSYYKTAAPDTIDLGDHALTERERAFLLQYYLNGLGEFAYRNDLDLSRLTLSPSSIGAKVPSTPEEGEAGAKEAGERPRALVPFGGGIDSIVTVEMVRPRADAALFVVSRPGDKFDAIEAPAKVTGLPIIRAGRQIDPLLFRSQELGFLNGHVPVTGILSAIAILAAVLDDRDAVVMSNEWSASIPTLERDGRPVNHQWSKSEQFERAFREVLAPQGLPDYFSALRDRTELWVGERFAELGDYHSSFRSCNRAFHLEKSRRLDHWCGECDKCCFIDLILAPFMPAAELRSVFDGREPLDRPELKPKFESLLGAGTKPFECVGEVNECRAAAVLAAKRPDRSGLVSELAGEVSARPDAPTAAEIEQLRQPVGVSFLPEWLR
jgi:UDP-N-acetyl-alpha-D-muramoyl-L-alanyl-L-glutamate epimerase